MTTVALAAAQTTHAAKGLTAFVTKWVSFLRVVSYGGVVRWTRPQLMRQSLSHTLDNFHENGFIYGHPITFHTISNVVNTAFDVAGIPAN